MRGEGDRRDNRGHEPLSPEPRPEPCNLDTWQTLHPPNLELKPPSPNPQTLGSDRGDDRGHETQQKHRHHEGRERHERGHPSLALLYTVLPIVHVARLFPWRRGTPIAGGFRRQEVVVQEGGGDPW